MSSTAVDIFNFHFIFQKTVVSKTLVMFRTWCSTSYSADKSVDRQGEEVEKEKDATCAPFHSNWSRERIQIMNLKWGFTTCLDTLIFLSFSLHHSPEETKTSLWTFDIDMFSSPSPCHHHRLHLLMNQRRRKWNTWWDGIWKRSELCGQSHRILRVL